MTSERLSVMMLSWEFPPRIIGGISSHVNDLSVTLSQMGVDVHVVTCDFPGAPEYEEIHGVRVYRFDSYQIPANSFLSWIFSMNQNMAERAVDIIDAHDGNIDLIHAHDWLVSNAATRLKDLYGKPLVSTIHATEAGRRGGLHGDYERTINEVERHLINESSKVVCCSNYMANQISATFNIPIEKLSVIRNGVDVQRFAGEVDAQAVKHKYTNSNGKMISYVGRLVHEKGVNVLIGAVPKVLRDVPNVNFVIVGEGGMREYLLKEAYDFGVADHVFFTGFLDEKSLISIYKASDALVVPSLYEPFGIVALEAMAAKTPVVVSDTGGLSEIVEHDKTGVKVYPNNSDSLAWGILRVLRSKSYANTIRRNACEKVLKDFGWNKITDETIGVYRQAMAMTPPRKRSKVLKFPYLSPGEYQAEFKILVLLQILGAVDREHASSAGELSKILKMKAEEITKLLQALTESEYVESYRDKLRGIVYYLTEKGIIKACSMFS